MERRVTLKIVGHFDIPYFQYLDESSQLVAPLPDFLQDPQKLLELYRYLVLTRLFDQKAIALQRTGKLGTYPSTRGQEAVFVGIGQALAEDDIYVPYYRDHGALIQRGVSLVQILLYWGGDERGNTFASQEQNFPYSVPVGSQPLYAAGAAAALKYKKQKRAVACVCGDGASSQGDFYEALNVAGVWRLPLVTLVCNNQWAISVPRDQQTAAQTLAQKAIAAGIYGEQVDGNDVIAVRARVTEALTKAREEHQPSLLELICYRQGDHTTADDASRYETAGLREEKWPQEPVARLRQYLMAQGLWSAPDEEKLIARCTAEVEQAVLEYQEMEPQAPETMFDYLYATLPKAYQQQRQLTLAKGAARGTDHAS